MNASVLSEPDEKRVFVRRMFDGIAGTYDLLNRVLSVGTDVVWRRKTVDALAPQSGERILDLATGTGDLGLEAAGRDPGIVVTGADISTGMLRYGFGKGRDRAARMTFLAGDADIITDFDASTETVILRSVASFDTLDITDTVAGAVVAVDGQTITNDDFLRPLDKACEEAIVNP